MTLLTARRNGNLTSIRHNCDHSPIAMPWTGESANGAAPLGDLVMGYAVRAMSSAAESDEELVAAAFFEHSTLVEAATRP